jgi:TolB protein
MTRLSAKLGLALVGCLLLAAPAQATFPGANGKIAFTADVLPGPQHVRPTGEIFAVNPDGTGEANFSNSATPGLLGDSGARWAPGGEQLAFTRTVGPIDPEATHTNSDIWVMNADGGDQRDLTAAFFGGWGGGGLGGLDCGAPCQEYGAVWSPEGTKLAFTGPDNTIYTIRPDGTDVTRVSFPSSTDPYLSTNPSWSPDSRKIAFEASPPSINQCSSGGSSGGSGRDIYVANADGSGLVDLTNNPANCNRDPSWSPDGTKIAFRNSQGLFVINADGNGASELASGGFWEAWSPNGRKIAFATSEGVFVSNVDGSDVVQVASSSARAVWSPDGTKIAFAMVGSIYTIDIDGTGLAKVVDDVSTLDDWQPIPFKNRAKKCKAEGRRGQSFGKCVSAR